MKLLGGLGAGLAAVLIGIGAAAAAALVLLDREPAERQVPARWQHGMNLTAFLPGAYGEPPARRAMLTARAAGTELVALVPTWYMESLDSSEVFADTEKTPTTDSLVSAANDARALGLDVVIKPHVDVLDGTFRGEILPADREAWFDSYESMLLPYAELAADVDARALVVGTELTSMALEPEPWLGLIERVREVYDGKLTFAANWVDGAESIEFWDQLDFIGVDAYMPLQTPSPKPTVGELVTAWGPYVVRMQALHERWEMPVLFTEVGYQDRVGTASRVGENSGEISQTAQADAYEAVFEALTPERWFRGVWWWEWSAEGPPDEPGGFTPEGKEAEVVLVEWLGPPEAISGSEPSGGSGSR